MKHILFRSTSRNIYYTIIFKVADFGLLRLSKSGEYMDSTCTKVLRGTPAYMPPEACMGHCTAKWDVWAFGVVSVLNKVNTTISYIFIPLYILF